jgi:hypothetical protein
VEGPVLIIMLTPILPAVGAAMLVTCDALRCSIGLYTRESMPVPDRRQPGDSAADLRARRGAVRSELDLRS